MQDFEPGPISVVIANNGAGSCACASSERARQSPLPAPALVSPTIIARRYSEQLIWRPDQVLSARSAVDESPRRLLIARYRLVVINYCTRTAVPANMTNDS